MLLAGLQVGLFVGRQTREATCGAAIRPVSVLGIGIRNAAGEAEGTGAAGAAWDAAFALAAVLAIASVSCRSRAC
jgi:hypothetical protein